MSLARAYAPWSWSLSQLVKSSYVKYDYKIQAITIQTQEFYETQVSVDTPADYGRGIMSQSRCEGEPDKRNKNE